MWRPRTGREGWRYAENLVAAMVERSGVARRTSWRMFQGIPSPPVFPFLIDRLGADERPVFEEGNALRSAAASGEDSFSLPPCSLPIRIRGGEMESHLRFVIDRFASLPGRWLLSARSSPWGRAASSSRSYSAVLLICTSLMNDYRDFKRTRM